MWLSRVSVHRPVFTTMVMITLMILGVLALFRLPVNLFPDVSLPVVAVIIPYPGATPLQVEEEVVKPAEEAIGGLPGLKETHATARDHLGRIIVMFEMGTDIAEANNNLRDRILALKATFPDGVEEPILWQVDPAAIPLLTFAVSGEGHSPRALQRMAEDSIKPRLERIPGVGTVSLQGLPAREVHVELDLARLAELRIPTDRVLQLLGLDTMDIPAGTLELGSSRLNLRTAGKPRTLDEIGGIVLQGYPQPVRVRDVARVVDGEAEAHSIARVNGQRTITMEVVKESGANTVAVAAAVMAEAEGMDLPGGVRLEKVQDTTDMIRGVLYEMRSHLLLGGLMAVLVVYLFMVDARSMLISALALPISILTTFFFMWLAGFSLNVLSLIGMILAVGVLIDDAVVVREVIFRHMEAGESPRDAAINGTSEVAMAVLATTLSILAVFIPVGFMKGMVGQFFAQFGLTVAFAVSVSLFVAFTMDPMLSAQISRRREREAGRNRAARALLGFTASLDRVYARVMPWALDHGKLVLGVSGALFLLSLGMTTLTGGEFLPRLDRSQFEVELTTTSSSPLSRTEEVAERAEQILGEIDEVTGIYTVVGSGDQPNRAIMRVSLLSKRERARDLWAVQDDARGRLGRIPGVTAAVRDIPLLEGAQMGTDLDVEIRGADLGAIQTLAMEIRDEMEKIPGLVNVQSSFRPSTPGMRLEVDRDRAAMAGLSSGQAGVMLRAAVEGLVVGTYEEAGRTMDIRVKARPEDQDPEALLSRVQLLSPIPRQDDPYRRGTPVALGDIARLQPEAVPERIERHDGQRVMKVTCSLGDRALSDAQMDVQALLDDLEPPPGVEVEITGMAQVAGEALQELLFALGLAILFVYAVLASQFESFVHPFTIMLSLPLAIVGAISAIFLAGWPIGILTMLGLILLMGLVTKNAILLVDRTRQLQRRGAPPREALLEAGKVRLRPILMTSMAMILAMLPPALAGGEGSELSRPMALPVIGGLIVSTLLTLLVVPVVYLQVELLRERLRALRREAP